MDDITASIIVQCQTSGAAASINKLGFSLAMLGKKAFEFGVQAVQEFRGTQDAAWKFGKTFANSMGSAEKAVRDFMDSYNLSEKTARSMLTDTAQVLKGFGFDEKQALKLSEQVSRMGVDMASFTGYAGGAKGAVEAITAAMLGETERLKGLGTVIRMDSDEFKNLTRQMRESKGVSEQQARAMAALELVMQKNKDAIGDYAAEGENFTQSVNNLTEGFAQLKSNIGEVIYHSLDLNSITETFIQIVNEINAWFKSEGPGIILFLGELKIGFISSLKAGYELAKPLLEVIPNAFTNIVNYGQWMNENFIRIWDSMSKAETNFFLGLSKDILQSTWDFIKWTGSSLGAASEMTMNAFLPEKYKSFYWQNLNNENANNFLSNLGRNTENALKAAGVTKAPELIGGLPDFSNVSSGLSKVLDEDAKSRKELTTKIQSMFDKQYIDKALPKQPEQPKPSMATNWGDFAKEFAKIRQTSQNAVLANSMEGMRLQSRMLMSPKSTDPAKRTADGIDTLKKQGEKMLDKMDAAIAAVVATNANTAALAGFGGTKKF